MEVVGLDVRLPVQVQLDDGAVTLPAANVGGEGDIRAAHKQPVWLGDRQDEAGGVATKPELRLADGTGKGGRHCAADADDQRQDSGAPQRNAPQDGTHELGVTGGDLTLHARDEQRLDLIRVAALQHLAGAVKTIAEFGKATVQPAHERDDALTAPDAHRAHQPAERRQRHGAQRQRTGRPLAQRLHPRVPDRQARHHQQTRRQQRQRHLRQTPTTQPAHQSIEPQPQHAATLCLHLLRRSSPPDSCPNGTHTIIYSPFPSPKSRRADI